MANATVQTNGAAPFVEVFIGGAGGPYDGRVTISLFDTNGNFVDLIPTLEYSTSNMRVPLFPNAVAANLQSLNGKIITWAIDVFSFTANPGEQYRVVVSVTQGGDPVAGSPEPQEGALTGGAKFVDGEKGIQVV